MKPFRARNPLVIGAVSIVFLLTLMALSFNSSKIPIPGLYKGKTYVAQFTDAAGLKSGDQVLVAGVRVGKVTKTELAGDHVDVSFQAEDKAAFGTLTGATIRIKTLLGQKYLGLEPRGPGQLDPETPIPVSRTVTPFDVVPAFSQLGTQSGQIDTAQLSQAFTTLADTFRDTPEEVRGSLDGLSRISQTIASRDQQLQELLANARGVTGVLANRNQEIVKLLRDGDLLLQAVEARRDVIHELLVNTRLLSVQIQGLVADNQAQLQPALQELQGVTDLLERNSNNLAKSIEFLGPYVRLFSTAIGSGRWFDTVIENIEEFPIDSAIGSALGGAVPGLPTPPGGLPPLPGTNAAGPAPPPSLAGMLQVPATGTTATTTATTTSTATGS